MKVLVTGAAGFIGSHLFDACIRKAYQTYGVDNYSIGNYSHPLIKKVDLLDKSAVDKLISHYEPEIIIHAAAWAHEGLSQFAPIKVTENNYNIHLNVLTAAINSGKLKHYVVLSSMSVYGDQIPPFTEDMPYKPVDIYAVAKTAIEKSTEILSKVHGFDYTIIRPHNVYGPRQILHDPYRNVVAIFINRCLAGKPFYIYGNGEQRRSFSYISDVIEPIMRCLHNQLAYGETFNVGPTWTHSINDLAHEILTYFPLTPEPVYVADRPLEVHEAFSSDEKTRRVLSFYPRISLREGIEHMVSWAKIEGHQKPRYGDVLEIRAGGDIPTTWANKLI